jgi:hypothetical protein
MAEVLDVLREIIDGEEVVGVLADGRSTSPAVEFERDVSNSVNRASGRLAVASVCRLDSRSTDALQVVDLLLGATALDLRQGRVESGTQKQLLLDHLLSHCGCASFRPGGSASGLEGDHALADRGYRGTSVHAHWRVCSQEPTAEIDGVGWRAGSSCRPFAAERVGESPALNCAATSHRTGAMT